MTKVDSQLLLDSFPHPAMIIREDRRILAANDSAIAAGAEVGDYCWKGFANAANLSDEHYNLYQENPDHEGIQCTFCRADNCLTKGAKENDPLLSSDVGIFDTYWVPISSDTYLHFAIDITERKRDEDAIKTAHKLLEIKNQEMEQFVYIVSHDLKSPLVTVKAFAGMLRQDLQGGDQQQINKDLNYIDKAADKMGQLLDALLQYSRIGIVNTPAQTVSADQQVQNCLTTLAGILQQHQVQVSTGELPQLLHGDPLHFGQIWQNLIENAVKYRGNQTQSQIEIGATQQAQDVVFYVRDNGMGIEPKHNERIFNLFSQLHSGSDGSGLGLALVKKIVTIYEGRIWIESAGAGQGSCFMFTLPGAQVKEGTAI